MKIKFNRYEKIAGLFVGVAILGSVLSFLGMAVKNGWFESRVSYVIELPSAEGLHAGTPVQMAGLRAGSIDYVELVSSDKVTVTFNVLEKFASKIKGDSHVQIFRPFVLGDRVLEVTVGSEGEAIHPGSILPVSASFDVMDFLSGKKMGAFLSSFEKLADSLVIMSDAFADPKRMKELVKTMDRLSPLVKNMTEMSAGLVKITNAATKKQRVEIIIENLALVSAEMGKMLPAFNQEVPNMGKDMGQIVKNLAILTEEFQKLTPAINAIAPDLPRTSKRAVEALDETVVLLKAMQKSWMLKSNVEKVRNEERQPAGEK
jgi:phospholipid/cholesterol/gamma-HCH transport system substrate-binding protein